MSGISEERKEALLRRYGNKTVNTGAGPGGMRPVGPGQETGRLRRTCLRGMKGGKPKNVSATINRLLAYMDGTR